jgi:hypothetical protein
VLASVFALSAALAFGAPAGQVAGLALGALTPPPDLVAHEARAEARASALVLELAPLGTVSGGRPPACSGDVCQPVVSVPGFEPRYGPAHRSEAFVALLTRARIEPLATVAWALVATGLRVDYTPVAFDGPNAGGHGWGSVFLRLRLRLSPYNAPVVPARPR